MQLAIHSDLIPALYIASWTSQLDLVCWQAAKAISYLINANGTTTNTASLGCPYPPPPNTTLDSFGESAEQSVCQASA